MNRDKALRIFNYLQTISDNFYLAGSARRGKQEDLHDLDVIYVGDETPIIPGHDPFIKGKDITRVNILGEHVDIYRTDPAYFGGMYFFLTGPQGFNIVTRGRAKKKGMVLNQKGLFTRDTKEPIATASELEIFNALGMKFVQPEDRRMPSWMQRSIDEKKLKEAEAKETLPF
jgi:DNA polymerase (family X)